MADLLSPLKTWKFYKELIIMTLGMLFGACGVYYFLVPSKLVIGSIAGLSIVVSTLLGYAGITMKVSTVVFLINAILLILAYFLIGKEFGLKTVYTALILGPLMNLLEKVLPYQKILEDGQTSIMGDPWLDLICFVLMLSICQAILFNINASTGGLDILAKIVNKYLHFDIGTSVTVAGGLICLSAFSINPFRMVLLGLIGTWINGLAVDYFSENLNRRKRVCIISDDHEKIRSFIIDDLHRGCSLYPMKGGYTGDERVEVQSILTKDEFAKVLAFMKKNKIDHFLTAGNVYEVHGKWNHMKKDGTTREIKSLE